MRKRHVSTLQGLQMVFQNPDSTLNPQKTVAEELRLWCKERIAAHKVPSSWFFTQAYPMTPSGKVQKFVLRDQVDAGQLPPLPVASAVATS